jgi:hypothetical protein
MNLQEVRAMDWINLALSIEALLFFETLVTIHLTTQRCVPAGMRFQQHRRENLKSHIVQHIIQVSDKLFKWQSFDP